jgi:hypothetical protein
MKPMQVTFSSCGDMACHGSTVVIVETVIASLRCSAMARSASKG